MSKKKIHIIVDGEVLVHDHFSGIGHYTASLLKSFDKLLSLPEYENIKLTIFAERKKVHRLHRFNFKNFYFRTIPLPNRIVNGLKRRDLLMPIDLLLGKGLYLFPNYSSWPTLFSSSIPIIYDLSFVKYPQFGDESNMKFLNHQVELSVNRASRVITISTNSKNEIHEHYAYPNSRIDIVYPIIDTTLFYKRSENEIAEIKAKYGIMEDSYIMFVGNIEPRKNLIGLLNAYESLPKDMQNKYSLLLVGAKGWKNDEIYVKIRDMRMKGLRIVQPIDYVIDEDLPALVSGASLFAYVSIYEGFGIPPVEALACDTAVVASDNSSLPEACGDAVIYTKAEDYKSISRAIQKSLISNHHDSEKGYKQADKFNSDATAEAFLKSIIKAISK